MESFQKFLRLFAVFAAMLAHSLSGQTIPLISPGTTWRYNQSGADLSGQFQQAAYNDSAWAQGPGLFGLEPDNPQDYLFPILTPLTVANGRITYYFRTHFSFPTNPAGIYFVITNYVDDGLVLYLNGLELGRVRMPSGSVNAATLASVANPEGQGFVLSLRATNLVQGDNVLAVEVHQSTIVNGDVVFGLSLVASLTPPPPPLPDLIIWGPAVNPRIETHTFAAGDCEVNEGCGIVGVRRLLRFDTETRNIGTADLVLGSPVGNPLFVYDSCHGHYHFFGFADYRLLDTNGVQVALGNKVGFCLEDLTRFDATAAPTPGYTCEFQGIQRGWGDIYSSGLPCQYVDITTVPPGTYTLELEIDPDHKLPESNETNNITRTTVVLKAPCTAPPPNDTFAAAQVISNRTVTAFGDSSCATRQTGEPVNPVNNGGKSIWYRWTAPYTGTVSVNTIGSNFDTIMAFYRGTSLGALNLLSSSDDINPGNQASQLTSSVASNSVYYISVDGYQTAADGQVGGDVVLSINPGGNDLFVNCTPLVGFAGSIGGSTTGAGREILEPNHAGDSGGHSIWYCWTAPASGTFVFATTGSRFDTLLSIYLGTNLATLQLIAENDDARTGTASQLSFVAVGGTTYAIALDGKAGASGISKLNWRLQPRLAEPVRIGGAIRFELVSAPRESCWIDISSDAITWIPWMSFTNTSGSLFISDSVSLVNNRRFYKARAD